MAFVIPKVCLQAASSALLGNTDHPYNLLCRDDGMPRQFAMVLAAAIRCTHLTICALCNEA